MKALILIVAALLCGCGQPLSTAMQPPQSGNFCAAPVSGGCLGCDIACPAKARPSCKAGTSTASNAAGFCTRAASCTCE